MLDMKFIRENTNLVREAIYHRQDNAPIDEIIRLDSKHRRKLLELEDLRHARKQTAREKRQAAVLEGRDLRNMARVLEDEVKSLDTELRELVLQVANIPQSSVPVGSSEENNIIIRTWGEPRKFSFQPVPHWKLGEALGIIDFERGVKLSGSRFYLLKGLGSRLQRAIINFMLDMHTSNHGYQEIYPPFMVKRETMIGSGNLPKFADNLYHDEEDDLWFVPTAEVPITNLHRDEIIPPGMLPFYYVAYSACFRREKMSAGKDTRGIKRGHQFDKVELYKITEPSTSNEELKKMTINAESICQQLGLPYRIKQLCTAELSFASTKSFDIDVWASGCGEWLEVSSCSNCTDFQARRANIRYRPSPDTKPLFVHTLNGSGLALPRIMIAILENYQNNDGSISVPKVLQPFVGKKVIK